MIKSRVGVYCSQFQQTNDSKYLLCCSHFLIPSFTSSQLHELCTLPFHKVYAPHNSFFRSQLKIFREPTGAWSEAQWIMDLYLNPYPLKHKFFTCSRVRTPDVHLIYTSHVVLVPIDESPEGFPNFSFESPKPLRFLIIFGKKEFPQKKNIQLVVLKNQFINIC